MAEITAQMAVPYGFWASVVPLYAARHRRTYELLRLVVQLAKHAEMGFKNAYTLTGGMDAAHSAGIEVVAPAEK